MPFFKDKEEIFFSKADLKDKIVYDIGANIGIMSILFAKEVGSKGFVLCFEPNPDSARQVSEILELNKFANTEVHPIAVGDKVSKETMVVHADQIGTGSLNSEIVDKFMQQGNNRFYEVDVFPLDVYIQQNNLPLPDFIKIDTEGYEFQCLIGMKNLLEKKHPELFIEMHAISDAHGESNAMNIVDLLTGYDYKIYSVRQEAYIDKTNYHLAKSGHLFCE